MVIMSFDLAFHDIPALRKPDGPDRHCQPEDSSTPCMGCREGDR